MVNPADREELTVHSGRWCPVAVAEPLGVLVLLAVAWWGWQRSVVLISVPRWEGGPAVSTSISGSAVTIAIGAVTLAGLLVVDLIRRLLERRASAQREG